MVIILLKAYLQYQSSVTQYSNLIQLDFINRTLKPVGKQSSAGPSECRYIILLKSDFHSLYHFFHDSDTVALLDAYPLGMQTYWCLF